MTAPPRTHPSTFLFLVIPFGMVTGYPVVTLAFLLAKNHVGLESIATISAAMYVPNLWKFLWAPVIDLTLTTRKWLFIGSIATAAGILAMSVIPMTASDLWLIGLVVVAANVGGTILSMTTTKLMACATTDEEKGRAGGWFNAGVTSGFGIGGGIGLLLAQHLPTPWMGGTILAMIGLGCGAPILFIQELPRMKIQGVFRGIASVCGEVWALGDLPLSTAHWVGCRPEPLGCGGRGLAGIRGNGGTGYWRARGTPDGGGMHRRRMDL